MVTLLFFWACNPETPDSKPTTTDDSDPPTDTADPETVALSGICEDANHWGNFTIDSNEDYAYVSGVLSNGVVPMTVLTRMLDVGDCTIWRRENPFCDPGCEPGFTCDLDGSCIPYPEEQDLGMVTVSGLLEPISMMPITPGYDYFYTDSSFPNPPWVAGSLLSLQSEGGSYAPFNLHGVAPVELQPQSMDWTVTPGAPFALSWDAPTTTVRSSLLLRLRIDQHGQTPSSAVCTFADDGAAEVPAEIIDSLVDLGLTGFPEGSLARLTADHTDIGSGGCVDLVASSSRLARVTIEGYTPCTRDEDCPRGQSCNETLERCEDE